MKPRGLEHRLGCAQSCRPSGCKRQLRRSGSLEWMRRFADVSCLKLRVCEHGRQVSFWVRAALEEENYADKGQSITEILKQNDVSGTALLKLTSGDMREMKSPWGRAKSWPSASLLCLPRQWPQADSKWGPQRSVTGRVPWGGDEREDDPRATEFIQELASAEPQDLGEGRLGALGWVLSFVCAAVAGVQVFNLTKSLPVEPYNESGPNLLTRNTTRRAWKATFELMKNNTKRVAMLGVPASGRAAIWRWASGTW